MIWIKHRMRQASGIGDWDYEYFHEKDDSTREEIKENVEYFLEDHVYSYSVMHEHFRGIDWEIVKEVPRNIFDEKIRDIESKIRQEKSCLDDLKNNYKKMYGE